jgi:hypothetical protein
MIPFQPPAQRSRVAPRLLALGSTLATILPGQTIFDDWRIRVPQPPANTLFTATYAEGRFVAAGRHATVISSTTGSVWETHYLRPGFTASGLVHADGLYVMVDRGGRVATSTDLRAWRVDAIGASSLDDLIHVNGRFIAVGQPSKVFSSPDGDHWSSVDIAVESLRLEGIAYGNGHYLTVARGGKLHRSPDLVNWSEVFAGYPGTENMTENWDGIAFFNGRFIAYGVSTHLLVSDNGTTWSEVPLTFDTALTHHVEWDGRLWLAGESEAILHSSDGLAWSRVDPGNNVSIHALAAAPGRLLALAVGGDVHASDDGAAWTLAVDGNVDDIVGMAYQNGRYVAISGKKLFLGSSDGVNWSPVLDARETTLLYEGVGVVDDKFVALSTFGRVASSVDGQDWDTASQANLSALVRTVSVANGVLFAGCDSGYLAHTVNGTDWTERRINPAGTGNSFRIEKVSHFNGHYFAAGGNGFLARSADLETWEPIPLNGTSAAMKVLLHLHGRYLLFPVSGSRILFSEDLLHWEDNRRWPVLRTAGAWVFGERVLAAGSGSLFSTSDGLDFTEHPLPAAEFRVIVFDGVQYVAGGADGVIATTGGTPLSALRLTLEGDGTVSRSPNQALYDSSTVVRLTAHPASDRRFLWWETAAGVVDSPVLDLVLTADSNVSAVFAGLEPPSASVVIEDDEPTLRWSWDPGWILHQSEDLETWSQAPGVQSSDSTGSLRHPAPSSGGRFFQFRPRQP